jgi:hypothetical protein
MKRLATQIALIGLIGAVVALVAFTVTASTPSYLGSPCREYLIRPGFSPWTGEPHGFTYIFHCDSEHPGLLVTPGVPDELAGRWAIPLPVGFVLGLGIGVLVLKARTQRVPPSGGGQVASA